MSYGAPTNQAPVANAGSDQTVTDSNGNGGEDVTLNGSASSDPDGNIESYVWREGTTVVGSGATPTVPLTVGTHTLTLTVTDDDNESDTDDVVVNVQPPPNQPPVANAGPNQTVTDTNGNGTESVTLNGSGSSDPDGNIVSYVWREGATTVGSGATPTVVLAVGAHTLILTVTDDDGATGTDNVVITVQSAPPPADTVAITKATYNSRNRQLVVEATSTGAPGVSLTAYNMSTGSPVPLGPLAYDAKKTEVLGDVHHAVKAKLDQSELLGRWISNKQRRWEVIPPTSFHRAIPRMSHGRDVGVPSHREHERLAATGIQAHGDQR